MPGSTGGEQASPKAKGVATSSSTNNGIFVRPVAVAGIFRPAAKTDNRPPALPEKRRFSALVGDFRPCSADVPSAIADDFERRRQSWDVRQQSIPFGQNLLRRTSKDVATTKEIKEENRPAPKSVNSSENSVSKAVVSSNFDSTDPNVTKQSVLALKTTTVSNSAEISNEIASKRWTSTVSKSSESITQTVATNSATTTILKASNSIQGSTWSPTKTNGKIEQICTETTSLNHGVVAESNELQEFGTKNIKVHELVIDKCQNATKPINNLEPDCETVKAKKVYGLNRRETKSGNNTESVKLESEHVSGELNAAPSPSKTTKVYGLAKATACKDEFDKLKNPVESNPKDLHVKSENSKCILYSKTSVQPEPLPQAEKCTETKIEPLPKDFRVTRRTSDVIAAKIQNIFSSVVPEKKPAIARKPKLVDKSGAAANLKSSSNVNDEKTSEIVGDNKASKVENNKSTVIDNQKNTSLINNNLIQKSNASGAETSNEKCQDMTAIVSNNVSKINCEVLPNSKFTETDSLKSGSSANNLKVSKISGESKVLPTNVIDNVAKNPSRNVSNPSPKLSSEVIDVSKAIPPCPSPNSKVNKIDSSPSKAKESKIAIASKPANVHSGDLAAKNFVSTLKPNNINMVKTEPQCFAVENKLQTKTVPPKCSAIESSPTVLPPVTNCALADKKSVQCIKAKEITQTIVTADANKSIVPKDLSSASKLAPNTMSTATCIASVATSCNENQKSFVSTSKTVTSSTNVQLTNGSSQIKDATKVEITKISPTVTQGIVPTVNVTFRTKSPQNAKDLKEENRKKVIVSNVDSSPLDKRKVTNNELVGVTVQSTAHLSACSNYKNESNALNRSAMNEALVNAAHQPSGQTTGMAKETTAHQTKDKSIHTIVNLQNEKLASVELSPSVEASSSGNSITTTANSGPASSIPGNHRSSLIVGQLASTILPVFDRRDSAINGEIFSPSSSSSHIAQRVLSPTFASSSSHLSMKADTMQLVDLDSWSRKFQQPVLEEPPRVPVRRRAPRDTGSYSRSSVGSRIGGSLKRIDLPRSPSQSCMSSTLPSQRFSYTEMLSKVCSLGILPTTGESSHRSLYSPNYNRSCSSSSSQVSELWSDLSEEQSAATHATEMLDAETTERMRLEKEVQDLQGRYSHMQQRSDKMELEMMEARVYRSELNGDLSEDDGDGSSSIYKQKYERAVRDMEIMKRRVQQQQEDEMEQRQMMKKASDKKLAEALEDVEEERQIANQWKRKAQKLGSELQDLRLMLEEQMGRNGELEKKQRRFDAELSAALEEIKKEKTLREKFSREKDQAVHEKYSIEQDLQSVKIDMDMQHEKITQLNKELDELTLSSKGEEEVTQLKRAKQELERKNRDQEEELEELAAQVQMLEQAKLRLEMALEKLRQEHRRESSVKEEEIEEIRASSSKKIKSLEAQLEAEQDERHQLVKQKHEMERRLYEMTDQPPPQDPEIERRLRRDLKRTKALLRDAQSMLEHNRDGHGSKSLIRQLKNQLEDAEFAKAAAVKARQAADSELQDLQTQLEEVTRTKNEAESRCLQLSREKSAIQTQLEETEEEMAEVMKKYKAVVAQMSIDQKSMVEQTQQIADLEAEKQMLKEQLIEVSHKFEHLAGQSEDTHKVHRLDGKVRELESKLELEQTTRARLENQISRLKELNDRAREECDSLRTKELQAQEGVRRFQRQIRELREDYSALQQKEADGYRKQHELEMALENTDADLQVTKNDLRLACQRIQDLQNALEDDLDSGTDVPDESGSDSDSSYEMSMSQCLTPVQRCDSVASNLSYDLDGRQSRTSSFTRELSAFSSRNDAEKELNGLPGLNGSTDSPEACPQPEMV